MLETNNALNFATNNTIPLGDIILQMEKELAMSGEEYSFQSTTAENLIAELQQHLKRIDTGTRISNLLYRIDVNASKLNAELPHYEALAVLAWNRVFQKVWFRTNFKTESK